MSRCLLAGLLLALWLPGQSLRAPPSHASLSSPASFSIWLESPSGKEPAIIQWEMVFPAAVEVAAADLMAGPAAESAAKSITCAKTDGKTEAAGAVRFACILAGGQKPIANGELAIVHFRLKQDVGGAPLRVAVEKVFATSADLKRIPISNIDAIISTQ